METKDLTITGLPSGLYASLAQAGLAKAGTLTTAQGQRQGLLVDEEGRVLLVLQLQNRNTKGQPMQVSLGLFEGPGFEAEAG
ncbi:MAG: hypothetical protein EOO59_18160 [Hymenobacter sp.]|nr:MAG: hypothetical protein EOO59_18160 [Hymenobacter sp.]